MADKPELSVVPKITPLSEQYKEYALKELRWAMQQIEAGEYHSVALCMVDQDGRGIQSWSECCHRSAMLGQITVLQGRFVKMSIDGGPSSCVHPDLIA